VRDVEASEKTPEGVGQTVSTSTTPAEDNVAAQRDRDAAMSAPAGFSGHRNAAVDLRLSLQAPPTTSFPQLVEKRLRPLFDEVLADLAKLGDNVSPVEAKPIRKKVGALRNRLDLMAPAFSKADDGKDPWLKMRKQLDDGYAVLGALKDIHDTSALLGGSDSKKAAKETKKKRKKALEWRDKFVSDKSTTKREAFYAAVDGSITLRPAKKQSRFYWGGAGVEPSPQLDAVQNLQLLASSMATTAADKLEAIFDAPKLDSHDVQQKFHDVRKAVRAVANVGREFPTALPNKKAAKLQQKLVKLADAYGDLTDVIAARDLAEERGQSKKLARLDDQLAKDWDALRNDGGSGGAAKTLRKYANELSAGLG